MPSSWTPVFFLLQSLEMFWKKLEYFRCSPWKSICVVYMHLNISDAPSFLLGGFLELLTPHTEFAQNFGLGLKWPQPWIIRFKPGKHYPFSSCMGFATMEISQAGINENYLYTAAGWTHYIVKKETLSQLSAPLCVQRMGYTKWFQESSSTTWSQKRCMHLESFPWWFHLPRLFNWSLWGFLITHIQVIFSSTMIVKFNFIY